MRKLISLFSFVVLCFGVAGCGDGTLEVKTKNAAPATPIVVVDKPAETTTKETKVETHKDGDTVKTKEVKTTNP